MSSRSRVVTPEKGSGQNHAALRDPTAGCLKIPSTAMYNRSKCCCSNPKECKEISKSWAKLDDMRGQMFQLPAVSASSRNQDQLKLKQGRLARISVHLAKDITGSVDRRVHTQDQPRPKRNEPKQPKRSNAFVAAHHIDPIVLREVRQQDTVSLDFLKANALWGNGYTDADRVKHLGDAAICYVVPSYSLESTKNDLVHLQQKEVLKELVEEVVEYRRGKYYQRRSNNQESSEDNGNGEKRQRLCTNVSSSREDLEAAICMLHEQLEKFIKEGPPPVATRESGSSADSNEAIEAFLKKKDGPLSRLTITSDLFHQNNPYVGKMLFGFEDPRRKEDFEDGEKPISSWELTKEFIWIFFGLEHKEPTMKRLYRPGGKKRRLAAFEECILTLIWIENKFSRVFLANLFGVNRNIVSKVIIRWAPEFGKLGADMARLELTKAFLDKAYPLSYIHMNFAQRVASIVDGSDVHMQTSRVDRAILVCQSSNKTGGSAARGITWSLPMGLVHEFTDLFLGRASEKSLVNLWAKHGRLRDLPVGFVMLGDKGFDQTSGCYHTFIPVIHPAFLKKGMQFTPEQLEWNRRACELRYTCEVVFSRVKKRGNLGGIVGRNDFPYLRDIWAWAHGRANLYQPLQRPANDDGYFGDSKYQRKNN